MIKPLADNRPNRATISVDGREVSFCYDVEGKVVPCAWEGQLPRGAQYHEAIKRAASILAKKEKQAA